MDNLPAADIQLIKTAIILKAYTAPQKLQSTYKIWYIVNNVKETMNFEQEKDIDQRWTIKRKSAIVFSFLQG